MRWLAMLALISGPALAEEVGRVGVDWTGNDIIVDAVADPQSGEAIFVHELIGAGDGHAQHLRHRVRVEEQRQLVIVGECGFLHWIPPL